LTCHTATAVFLITGAIVRPALVPAVVLRSAGTKEERERTTASAARTDPHGLGPAVLPLR